MQIKNDEKIVQVEKKKNDENKAEYIEDITDYSSCSIGEEDVIITVPELKILNESTMLSPLKSLYESEDIMEKNFKCLSISSIKEQGPQINKSKSKRFNKMPTFSIRNEGGLINNVGNSTFISGL